MKRLFEVDSKNKGFNQIQDVTNLFVAGNILEIIKLFYRCFSSYIRSTNS